MPVFTAGEDFLGLTGSLTAEQLAFSAGTGTNANDTLVKLAASGELLAILKDVPFNSLTSLLSTNVPFDFGIVPVEDTSSAGTKAMTSYSVAMALNSSTATLAQMK